MGKYNVQIDINAEDNSHAMILRQIQPNSSVLEFGPAAGAMTQYMRQVLGCNVCIVEINKLDYEQARQWAEDGVCGNIEDYTWLKKFGGKKFDYVLFADILEHLSDPQSVLQQVRVLLKEDGEVIASVPNMAYCGILAELSQNQFRYRETGLLDKTHIHFFAYQSFVNLFHETGYCVTIYDATRCPLGNSEFKEHARLLTSAQIEFLESKRFADVYQFVFTAVKKEFFEQNAELRIQDRLGVSEENHKVSISNRFCSRVYFDCGTGFSEKNCIDLEFEEGSHIRQRIQLPKDCKSLRFDPARGFACLVFNLHIRTENVSLRIKNHNGAQLNDIYVFNSADSQIYVEELPLGSQFININAEIITIDQGNWIRLVHEIESLNRERTHYKNQYMEAANRLAEVQKSYDVISSATFWKMTKPLRVFVDFTKHFLQSNRYIRLFYKGLKCLRENSFRYTWRKVRNKLRRRRVLFALYTPKELDAQRTYMFPRVIKFSIVVPLYNTPEKFLHEMIRSVLGQTYGDWELCMADGSDQAHTYVEQICWEYAEKDNRVLYRRLESNKGISENTNACVDMATGDYIGLLDHDDLLHSAALFEVMRAICEQDADFIYTDEKIFFRKPNDGADTNFKPDFAPDTLRSYNYICHFTVFSRQLMESAGGKFRPEFDGSQDYEMILRLSEKAEHIVHIAKSLYYWRIHESSTSYDVSMKPYITDAAKKALAEHLERLRLSAAVQDSRISSVYHIRYEIKGTPLISILIPNKDHIDDLKKCIRSIVDKTTYYNWEIIIIENNSTEKRTFEYYRELEMDPRIHVVGWTGKFNYSAINNYGVQYAKGEHILLLNNDTEVISPDWLGEMLMFSQRPDVGAVGAMLYYPDDTIQHAGIIIGLGGIAAHSHKHFHRGDGGYVNRLALAQNLSAVTGACMMLRREVWDQVGGLDESFVVALNDVDLCLRIRQAGYLIVWTPFAELYHYESKSRGYEDTPDKKARFADEKERFKLRWKQEIARGDPYYNPNLTLDKEDFSLR